MTISKAVTPATRMVLFPSTTLSQIQLSTVATNKALPTVTIGSITGTISHAYLEMRVGRIYNSAGAANEIDGDQWVQVDNVAAGGLTNAIFIDDEALRNRATAGVTENASGCSIWGATDIGSKCVSGGGLTSVQWTSAKCGANNLYLQDITMVLHLVVY